MPGYEIASARPSSTTATDSWKAVASEARDRHYHETATCCPMAVLSGGMSSVATCTEAAGPGQRFFATMRRTQLRDLQPPTSSGRGRRSPPLLRRGWGSQFKVNMVGSDEIAASP